MASVSEAPNSSQSPNSSSNSGPDQAQTAQKPGASRWLVVVVPYLWLLLFFAAPFFIILKISFSDTAIAMPPYTPLFKGFGALGDFFSQLDFENYVFLTEDPLYIQAYLSSLRIAVISTLLLLLIGYPIALAMARAPTSLRPTLVMLVILPFWTSFLIRVYAWIGILKPDGLLTLLLQAVGFLGPQDQVQIFRTDISVYIGIVYSYLPFMVLPLYATLQKLDGTLLEAAADLGATPLASFVTVTLPLSLPGILAGSAMVFIPAIGEFVIPDLLGGSDTLMVGKVLWNEFFSNRDWPLASAVAIVLLFVLVLPLVLLQRARGAAPGDAR